jgi:glucose-1-phosphate cytidylyltransferase
VKIVILCGGLGTRLSEETGARPKPMVEIGGRPILWHIMRGFAARGFREFVLCLGYRADVVRTWFLNFAWLVCDVTVEIGPSPVVEYHQAPEELGWKVTLADTGLDAMTGCRLHRVAGHLSGGPFLLTYGDGVSDIPLARLLEFHRAHGRLATVTGVHPPSRFGELLVDGDRVLDFSEKPLTSQGLINGGFFVMERGVLDYVSGDPSCVLEREPLERLARDGQLMVYRHDGFWQCMDTMRDVKTLEALWASGKAPWKVW